MGDFELTIDTLHRVVAEHGKVHDDLTAANLKCQPLAEIRPPMRDPATTGYVTAASQAGRQHLDAVTRIERELQARIDALKASVDQYEKTERANQRRLAVQD
ncbi:hypothetical protein GCM10010178_74330 [Lentzea flava]|uniref:PE family protein n=1 Tax=Lentzea flava TaxID=103732 RepID=A0ABQ2V771_9PSEU|nr:PE family protein [Lentzea flava]GGU71831.1 hypothetical protein GCM10010178_74330 [Lentzea flava]